MYPNLEKIQILKFSRVLRTICKITKRETVFSVLHFVKRCKIKVKNICAPKLTKIGISENFRVFRSIIQSWIIFFIHIIWESFPIKFCPLNTIPLMKIVDQVRILKKVVVKTKKMPFCLFSKSFFSLKNFKIYFQLVKEFPKICFNEKKY